jgi:hypothetical protein
LTLHGRNYYAFGDVNIDLEGITVTDIDSDTLYLAFGERDQTLITPAEDVLDDFLRDGSFDLATLSSDLIVLRTDRTLMTGGLDTRHPVFGNGDGPWESSMFRNVETFGLVVADAVDEIAITIEARSASDTAAAALANIARGIVSLKALAQDEDGEPDPDLAWIDRLDIASDARVTRFSLGLPAEQLVQIID